MSKNTWAAVQVEENGKFYAYAVRINESDNALCKLAINGIVAANIYKTKKDACEVVEAWRTAFIRNGCYLF